MSETVKANAKNKVKSMYGSTVDEPRIPATNGNIVDYPIDGVRVINRKNGKGLMVILYTNNTTSKGDVVNTKEDKDAVLRMCSFSERQAQSHLELGFLSKATALDLIGAELSFCMFQKGDTMYEGAICTDDDTIVHQCQLEQSEEVAQAERNLSLRMKGERSMNRRSTFSSSGIGDELPPEE